MTNVTLSVLKDKAFAAMFGKGVSRPMSYTSMGNDQLLHYFVPYFQSFLFIVISDHQMPLVSRIIFSQANSFQIPTLIISSNHSNYDCIICRSI